MTVLNRQHPIDSNEIKFSDPTGMSGDMQLVLTGSQQPEVSLVIKAPDGTSHCAKVKDTKYTKFSSVKFTLQPMAENAGPFTITVTRNPDESFKFAGRLAVDYGTHPAAERLNRPSVLGSATPLGACTVLSTEVERTPPQQGKVSSSSPGR
ncbi:MAG: hypothetical protein ACOYNL_05490 [Rickettsiales bacterium]